MNKVFLTGNLTRDPEVRNTSTGTKVLVFSVAVTERVKNGDTWMDRANFVDCTGFGNRVDYWSRNLAKGTKVCVMGRLHWTQWEAKDGTTRSKLEVIVEELESMPKKTAPVEVVEAAYEEDIPF